MITPIRATVIITDATIDKTSCEKETRIQLNTAKIATSNCIFIVSFLFLKIFCIFFDVRSY